MAPVLALVRPAQADEQADSFCGIPGWGAQLGGAWVLPAADWAQACPLGTWWQGLPLPSPEFTC